ncbi:MAG: hypothetical protein ACD_65C00346G0004 [uncultured bacterium]|nr:MAG: hypothetical protein ACD_65C00346G0004 [uncultured bacterium]KKT02594.1 MAG: hypothetical protein UV80_C0002G0061 [Candidatus Peregrinibacteria bacterium GW2011_GWF2_43_17]KKT20589.1 MAG: hypothetical protein UW03_C0002G0055 [Candidatus Peregrinibacteria bacterium GW2011_GWA2_43_8]HAU39892.1 hypothetical protein [Candidatus Peregrinibacteria bacterium]
MVDIPGGSTEDIPEEQALKGLVSTNRELKFAIRLDDGREFRADEIKVGERLALTPKRVESISAYAKDFLRFTVVSLVKIGVDSYMVTLNNGPTVRFSMTEGSIEEIE